VALYVRNLSVIQILSYDVLLCNTEVYVWGSTNFFRLLSCRSTFWTSVNGKFSLLHITHELIIYNDRYSVNLVKRFLLQWSRDNTKTLLTSVTIFSHFLVKSTTFSLNVLTVLLNVLTVLLSVFITLLNELIVILSEEILGVQFWLYLLICNHFLHSLPLTII
jgi:hypothetical protein